MSPTLQDVGRAVKAAQYRHHRWADRELTTIGTTLPQWDALRAIAQHPGSSAHWLAGRTFQSDQAFGTLAGRLVDQGLVVRSPGQGRRIEHHLTPAGQAMFEAGSRVANRVLEQSFGGLTPSERSTLFTLLERVGIEQSA
ncbi:MAG: MarR family winged helix-turn-helix transcriptional regulator [Pseudolysinimonas sp.]